MLQMPALRVALGVFILVSVGQAVKLSKAKRAEQVLLQMPADLRADPPLARGPTVEPSQTTSYADFIHTGLIQGDDPLSQLRGHINKTDDLDSPFALQKGQDPMIMLEMSTTVVRSYCEICILVMQMKERGEPHLCAGLNANYWITCVEVLESLLRADKAIVYWLKNGCMHMDASGPEIVRPCPALSICSWVPNLFAQPPSLVRDGIEALCPKDPKFLPTIPEEYKSLLGTSTEASGTTPPAATPKP